MSELSKGSAVIALAGQPNCGKSTIFNMLTGARQYVANYPGVTVDKMYGNLHIADTKITVVDLPGTYAFTSYSPEEKAAREFILHEHPDAIVAVVDASTLDKGLYFVMQLLEMKRPVIIALNMMDVALRRGLHPDPKKLSQALNIPVVALTAAKKQGHQELLDTIASEIAKKQKTNNYVVDYGSLTSYVGALAKVIEKENYPVEYPSEWLALKLFEEDPAILELIKQNKNAATKITAVLAEQRTAISVAHKKMPVAMVTYERHAKAREMAKMSMHHESKNDKEDHSHYQQSLTDKIDSIFCHRIFGPICLVLILFLFYQVSVTWGNELADWVLPFWTSTELLIADLLPMEGFLTDPFITSLGNWLVKGVTAVLYYLPIFLLMFSFVAILEDSGYLARIAFVLDRVFNTFGLHGQSTLPLILGGIYVGGCAIPGVVATRAIPDERARFATIMIIPMMNCLAKVPLYFMLIGVFYADVAGSAMFFMGTITLIIGLTVAKVLSLTLLKGRPPSPFLIELPSYHMPTLHNVVRETTIRVWMFIKKIMTVVVTVSTIVYIFISYPNLPTDRQVFYDNEQRTVEEIFLQSTEGTEFAGKITTADLVPLILYQAELQALTAGQNKTTAQAISEQQLQKNPLYAAIVLRQGKAAEKIADALLYAENTRKTLRRDYQTERFEESYLGRAGKFLEPVTAGAGFDWRINVALLSALAAKENSAATLGSLYGIDGSTTAESFKQNGSSFNELHALALMLFMALYPPCLAAAIMVRTQTGSTGWMLFAVVFQISIGLAVATLVFSGGTALGLTGVETMWSFYALCLILMLIVGFIPAKIPTNHLLTTNSNHGLFL